MLIDIVKDKEVFIFDFNGVIFDNECFLYLSYKKTLDSYGIGSIFSFDIYKDYYFGKSSIEIMKSEVLRAYNLDLISYELFEVYLSDKTLNSMCNLKNSNYYNFILNDNAVEIKMNNFIADLLNYRKVNSDLKFYILSGESRDVIVHLLSKWNCCDLFVDIISVSDNFSNKEIELNYFLFNYNCDSIVYFEDSELFLSLGKKLNLCLIGVEHDFNKSRLCSYDFLIKGDNIYE